MILQSSDPYPIGHYLPWIKFDGIDDMDDFEFFARTSANPEPALMKTCRQIRAETRSLYFGEYLCFELSNNYLANGLGMMIRWAEVQSQACPSLVKNIRKIRVRIECGAYHPFEIPEGWHGLSACKPGLDINRLDLIVERSADGRGLRVSGPCELDEGNEEAIDRQLRQLSKGGEAFEGKHLLELVEWLQSRSEARGEFVDQMGQEYGRLDIEEKAPCFPDNSEESEDEDEDEAGDSEGSHSVGSQDEQLDFGGDDDDESDFEGAGSVDSESEVEEEHKEWILWPKVEDCEPIPGRKRHVRLHYQAWKTIASVGWV